MGLGLGIVGALRGRVERFRRRRRAVELFTAAGLFDADWYRRTYPEVGKRDPIDHFLEVGEARQYRPHPMFDVAWYHEHAPDVRAVGVNALIHFIQAGSAEGRDPNPFFSSRWYGANNPDAAAFATGLSHYAQVGVAAGRDPSPRFDIAFYAERNADLLETGLDPFSHFLLIGRREGRAPTSLGFGAFRGEPVESARIVAFKALAPIVGEKVALMACHCPHGRFKPNVRPYVEGLVKAGLKVVAVAATDRPFDPDPEVTRLLSGGFVRDNFGFDFGSWAHVLRCEPSFYATDTLFLVNDSLIGPTDQAQLDRLVERIGEIDADMVGATDNQEHAWHLQSFFLALKTRVLTSYALRKLFDQVRVLKDKDHVIRAYELTFSASLQEAGFTCRPVFDNPDGRNSSAWGWRRLMADGFPFAKTLTLRGDVPDCDIDGWQDLFAEAGYDPALAQAAIDETTLKADPPEPGWPLLKAPAVPPRPREPWKVALIGPWNYANGLGEASRSYLSALWRAGLRLNLYPVEASFHVHARATPTLEVTEFDGQADAVLLHLNPDAWPMMTEGQQAMFDRARVRIGLPVWEMDRAPDNWREPLKALDAVWAPSRYCADAFTPEVRGPVSVIPYVVPVPPPEAPGRRREALDALGLGAGERLILYVFDGSSYLVRKNPDGLIRAFAAAGLAGEGWRLMLKTKHLGEAGAPLRAQVAQTPGVRLIDAALPRTAMHDLWDAAGIYVSPHRSEGFGLTVAEAMARGKLVVATDYSGPRDFLDADCGYPVAARAHRLAANEGAYKKGGSWADPDEADLARQLRAAADNPNPDEMGARARARIADRLSAEGVARAMRDSLAALIPGSEARL